MEEQIIHQAVPAPYWTVEFLRSDGVWTTVKEQHLSQDSARADAEDIGRAFNLTTRIRETADRTLTPTTEELAAYLNRRAAVREAEWNTPAYVEHLGDGRTISSAEYRVPHDDSVQVWNAAEDAPAPAVTTEQETAGEVTQFAETAEPVGVIEPDFNLDTEYEETETAPEVEWLDTDETVERPETEWYITVVLSTQRPDEYHRSSIARFMAPEEEMSSVAFTLAKGVTLPDMSIEAIEAEFGETIR